MPRAPAVYVPAPLPLYTWTGFISAATSVSAGSRATLAISSATPSAPATASRASAAARSASITNSTTASWSVPRRCSTGGLTTTTPRRRSTLVNPPASRRAARFITANNQWLTTATGKLGYAWDRVMLYAKAGGAWVGSSNPTIAINGVGVPVNSSTSSSNWGWTVGAGAEYAFYGGWSARIEYDYIGLTNQTFTVPAPADYLPAINLPSTTATSRWSPPASTTSSAAGAGNISPLRLAKQTAKTPGLYPGFSFADSRHP